MEQVCRTVLGAVEELAGRSDVIVCGGVFTLSQTSTHGGEVVVVAVGCAVHETTPDTKSSDARSGCERTPCDAPTASGWQEHS
ncbi:MAG: hypothetical protein WBB39_04005 [Candidatus Saccharimonadales bacterium]